MRWLRLGPQGTSDYTDTRENFQPLLVISGKVYGELEILIKSWAVSLRSWGLGMRASKPGITGRHWLDPRLEKAPPASSYACPVLSSIWLLLSQIIYNKPLTVSRRMSAFVQPVQVSVLGLMSEVGVALQDRSFNSTTVPVQTLGINPRTE